MVEVTGGRAAGSHTNQTSDQVKQAYSTIMLSVHEIQVRLMLPWYVNFE